MCLLVCWECILKYLICESDNMSWLHVSVHIHRNTLTSFNIYWRSTVWDKAQQTSVMLTWLRILLVITLHCKWLLFKHLCKKLTGHFYLGKGKLVQNFYYLLKCYYYCNTSYFCKQPWKYWNTARDAWGKSTETVNHFGFLL